MEGTTSKLFITQSANPLQRLYKCYFLCKAKIIYVSSKIDAADADDGYKRMLFKSFVDKVIEANPRFVLNFSNI